MYAEVRFLVRGYSWQEVLPNGLRVLIVEDHEVPLVQGVLMMRGGKYASPSDKVKERKGVTGQTNR